MPKRHPRASRHAARPRRPRLRWDLSDIYTGLNSRALLRDKREIARDVREFARSCKGRVAQLDGAGLGAAIEDFERISGRLDKIDVYTTLLKSENVKNDRRVRPLENWVRRQQDQCVFFKQEIHAMRKPDLFVRLADPRAGRYAPWIGHTCANPDYPSTPLEKRYGQAINEYNRIMAGIRVDVRGTSLSLNEAIDAADAARDEGESARIRAAAARELKKRKGAIAKIFNITARRNIEMTRRAGHDNAEDWHHADSRADRQVFDTITAELRKAYPRISQIYHASPAGAWDDGCPAREYAYTDACRAVIRSFRALSPDLARIVERVFDGNHIDAKPRRDKSPGCFSMIVSGVPTPYIQAQFGKTYEDVAILAHECGHAAAMVLGMREQGFLMHDLPATVAEIPSIFGEKLLQQHLLEREEDPAARRRIIRADVSGAIESIFCQLAYYDFEAQAHREIAKGPMGAERISEAWLKHQRAYMGRNGATWDTYTRYEWMTVPHFFDMSFYVRTYIYGQLGANVLYKRFRETANDPAARRGFVDRYIGLQKAGLRMNFREAMAHMGVDAASPQFVREALAPLEKGLKQVLKHNKPAA